MLIHLMLFLHQTLKVTSLMTGAYYTQELGQHSSNNEIYFYCDLKNLVLESHHSLGKNDLNTTGIMFWTILHSTCCLLKMSLDRLQTNKPSACPRSPHLRSCLQVTLGGKRGDRPHELLLSQPLVLSTSRHDYNYNPFVAHACVC